MARPEEIINEFAAKRGLYERFTAFMAETLHDLLKNRINHYILMSRVKEVSSLEEKLIRRGNKYETLSDITDLAGLRVITTLTTTVAQVGDVLGQHFKVDPANSPDKRWHQNPDAFGYQSVHFVCGIDRPSEFQGLVCEIQVRTILQHAWAEIEHDTGYKPEVGVPLILRRRFLRLAALLEIADEEFVNVVTDLADYTAKMKVDPLDKSSAAPLDSVTLKLFLMKHSDLFNSIERELYGAASPPPQLDRPNPHLDRRLRVLKHAGITTAGALAKALEENRTQIIEFEKRFRPKNRTLVFYRPLHLLSQIEVFRNEYKPGAEMWVLRALEHTDVLSLYYPVQEPIGYSKIYDILKSILVL